MKFSRLRSPVMAFCLGFLPAMASQAALLDLSEVPITVGSTPEPNVMLLLDNSTSMRNLNWPDKPVWGDGTSGFNPNKDYTTWCGPNCANNDRWHPTDDYVRYAEIDSNNTRYDQALINNTTYYKCTTPGGATGGVNVMGVSSDETVIKCLYLPGNAKTDITGFALTGNYLNYLFTKYGTEITLASATAEGGSGTEANPYRFTSSLNLADGQPQAQGEIIPIDRRVDSVKDIVTNDIITISGIRFGLAQFANSDDGANILQGCGSSATDIATSLQNDYVADTGTPLSEALYEVTRYFRGMDSFYDTSGQHHAMHSRRTYTSPIEFPCQSNFTIVLTDGLATRINKWPNSGDDDDLCKAGKVTCDGSTGPDWDGEHPDEGGNTAPPFLQFSDGHKQNGNGLDPGKYIFTDDIALFGYVTDMVKGVKNNINFDQPPFDIQNMNTITIGFGLDSQVLKDAAWYGNGMKKDKNGDNDTSRFYNASSSNDLKTSLIEALNEIKIDAGSSSAASVAASTGYISDGSATALYQGQFEFIKNDGTVKNVWTGHLLKYPLKQANDNTNGDVLEPTYDAAEVLDATKPDDRKIFSYDPALTGAKGITFNMAGLSSDQQNTLTNEILINYIRGVRDCEAQNDPASNTACKDARDNLYSFRDRKSRLGTIVSSSPLSIPEPSSIYPDNWGIYAPEYTNCKPGGDTSGCYSQFKKDYADRKDMIYAGANDGMLHAFDPEDMTEKFAYVPNVIIPKLATYGDPGHLHKYYVDGTPTVIDAYDSATNKWRTILVGSLGKGGQGLFALDITDVGMNGKTLETKDVLWEFTDADHQDLGYTYSRPAIVRMKNGRWMAVFGNGYNNTETDGTASTSGNAVLYFVDLFTGKLRHIIDTNIGLDADPANDSNPFDPAKSRPNGLSSIAPVDINNDMVVDYIYAGDIYGNMWRFDVTSSATADWKIYGKGLNNTTDPIFTASYTGSPANPQSITSRPEVARAGPYGVMLYFGTGMYLGLSDNLDIDNVQSFYGLIDDPEGDHTGTGTRITRGDMIQQTFETYPNTTIDTQVQDVRRFSEKVAANLYKNWYINLYDGKTKEGERVVGTPVVRGAAHKRVIFVSIIPNAVSCSGGGRSWLIELDARNGNLTKEPVFDLNGDGKLDKLDNGGQTIVYNGWSQQGIQSTPTIIVDGAGGVEHKYMSSTNEGGIVHIREALPPIGKGRQSWRQIK